jgi:hypothetical protein
MVAGWVVGFGFSNAMRCAPLPDGVARGSYLQPHVPNRRRLVPIHLQLVLDHPTVKRAQLVLIQARLGLEGTTCPRSSLPCTETG